MINKDQNSREKFLDSLSFRLIILGILILVLLIPIASVKNLIRERQLRRDDVISEVSSKWGRKQTLTGPVLTIPFNKRVKKFNAEKKIYETKTIIEYLHVLPEYLNYNCDLLPEERYRGIFKVVVYKSQIQANGMFVLPDLEEHNIQKSDILWENILVSLRISDFRSLQDDIDFTIANNKFDFKSGTSKGLSNGVYTNVRLDEKIDKWSFNLDLDFYGSSDLMFTPLGKTTDVTIKSSWKNPSFIGGSLPDHREITNDGFNASWKILHLNRPIKQLHIGSDFIPHSKDNNFGVKLFLPVDHYKKSERSVKYAILFISLTFIVFFSMSVINKIKIHPIQYLLIGLALSVFYSLLLSISEQLGFDLAYWISAASMIILLSLYSKAIFKNRKFSLSLGGVVLLFYAFIFVIIQMQDYALLIGSIGLFAVVSILMYLSIRLRLSKE